MMTPNIQTICSLAVGTTMIALSSAHAGDTAPVLEVDWIVDGVADAGSLTGSGLGAGVYEYANSTIGDGFEINWSFIVTDNGASGGFEILSSALAFTNTSDAASVFEIGVLLPVGLAPGTAFYGGSISGSLTGDIDGGLLATSGDSALFAALGGGAMANLGDLRLQFNRLGDAGVDSLVGDALARGALRNLWYLGLADDAVLTDGGVKALEVAIGASGHLPRLEFVTASGPATSEAARLALQTAFTNRPRAPRG